MNNSSTRYPLVSKVIKHELGLPAAKDEYVKVFCDFPPLALSQACGGRLSLTRPTLRACEAYFAFHSAV